MVLQGGSKENLGGKARFPYADQDVDCAGSTGKQRSQPLDAIIFRLRLTLT